MFGKLFLEKGQIINILDFSGHMVSVATAQLCCGAKAAMDKMQTGELLCAQEIPGGFPGQSAFLEDHFAWCAFVPSCRML